MAAKKLFKETDEAVASFKEVFTLLLFLLVSSRKITCGIVFFVPGVSSMCFHVDDIVFTRYLFRR